MICPSGKRSFPSRRAARRATRTVGNRIRVYRCPDCHGWHITAQARPLPPRSQGRRRRHGPERQPTTPPDQLPELLRPKDPA